MSAVNELFASCGRRDIVSERSGKQNAHRFLRLRRSGRRLRCRYAEMAASLAADMKRAFSSKRITAAKSAPEWSHHLPPSVRGGQLKIEQAVLAADRPREASGCSDFVE